MFVVDVINFELRRAGEADIDQIAAAHLDSIRSIGARYYEAAIVDDWAASVKGSLYSRAMTAGEVFYVAIGPMGDAAEALGFSSYRNDEGEHRTAVYVRGKAARRGIGSALFRRAEAAAIAAGAPSIYVAASLAAVDFYAANGFEPIRRGEHRLSSGRSMPCVFMRKTLARP